MPQERKFSSGQICRCSALVICPQLAPVIALLMNLEAVEWEYYTTGSTNGKETVIRSAHEHMSTDPQFAGGCAGCDEGLWQDCCVRDGEFDVAFATDFGAWWADRRQISQYNLPPEERYGVKNLFLVVNKRLTMCGFIVSDPGF